MKMSLMAVVLAFAGFASGQQTFPANPATPQPQSAAPGAAAQPQQKKEIKDPAEYNAYVGAIQQADDTAKISGLEAFLKQYPNSVMKEDALEALLAAYQKTNNQPQMLDAAQRIVQADPNNLQALALLTYTARANVEGGKDPQKNLADATQYATRGLQALPVATKPEGMTDADFGKLKNQAAVIFNGAAGFAALQSKDYAHAEQYLRAAIQTEPNDLRNVYPLALAYLTGTPPDNVNGLFFIARAATLMAGAPNEPQIEAYGKSQYSKYHGSDQGWTDVLAAAKTSPLPPAGFTVTQYVPPTPAQQAHDLVKDKTPDDIKKMSFADWELVLSAGSPEDGEKVWSVIKGVALQMEATVIQATPTEVQVAASQDDIDQKRADIVVTMTGPIPERSIPKDGASFDFGGTPLSYVPSPFVMTMEKGVLLRAATPKKAPVHHKTTTQ